jgi:isopenicillin N synthase-like dioxygenase
MTEYLIPCIDLAPSFMPNGRASVAAAIRQACETVGFFTIVGHQVPIGTIQNLQTEARAFFALPEVEKRRVPQPPSRVSRGYVPPKQRALGYSLGTETPPDLQEGFGIGPLGATPAHLAGTPAAEFFFAPNVWPNDRPDFRTALETYFRAMEALAVHLLRLFAVALHLDPEFFDDKVDQSTSILRTIWYPPQPEPPESGQLRAGEHSDYGTLTILKGDDVPGGLQVRLRNGSWVDVHPHPDAFVCNIGDLMMRWTNDEWLSNVHRVANPPREAAALGRLSIPFFHNPNADAIIASIAGRYGEDKAAKYPATVFADHYLAKHTRAAQMTVEPVLQADGY